jgi:Rad52/22 family double-strand break repair protein
MTDHPQSPGSSADDGLGPHGLTHAQYRQLLKAINEARVLRLQGDEYLAAWDVQAHLTRIFGFGGWDDEDVVPPTMIFEDFRQRRTSKGEPVVKHEEPVLGWWAAYKCTVKLTVRNPAGGHVATHTGDATGSADNQPDRAAAHDLAIKSAASIALKRAAIKLGDQFGLSLYADTHKAVVGGTLVWQDPDAKSPDDGEPTAADGVAVTALGQDDVGTPRVGTTPSDDDTERREKPPPGPQRDAASDDRSAGATARRRSGRRAAGAGDAPQPDAAGSAGAGTGPIPKRGEPDWRQPPRSLIRRFNDRARRADVDEPAVTRFFQDRYGVDGPADLHHQALTTLVDRLATDDGLTGFKTYIAGLTGDAPADGQAELVTTGGGGG